ncbi:MAG: OmpA family protein [Calditrichota bacterium]
MKKFVNTRFKMEDNMSGMRYYLTLILVLLLTTSMMAQLRTRGVALGLAGGPTVGDLDFGRDEKFGIQASAFIRHSLFGPVEGQLTGNFLGKLTSDDNPYTTDINSGDYRLLVRLFWTEFFSPYIYGGGGAVYYEATTPPAVIDNTLEPDGFVPFGTGGAGFQIKVTDIVSLDLSGGYNLTNSDALNQNSADDTNDGWFSGMGGLTFTLSSNQDPDGDGLSNKEEKKLGTDKEISDTDGDGLSDGEEVTQHNTDPLNTDTDSDGLSDGEEVVTYNTNPDSPDSDGDGLTDMDEALKHNTDPLKKDTDGDRVSDKDEIEVSKTDPNKSDSDSDGLDDGSELTEHKTDAMKADTDDDGLSDGKEVKVNKTNPLQADTDGGSVNDGAEVARGTNPLNADDDVVLEVTNVGAKIVLDGIVFASGKSDITAASEAILERAYQTLVAYPDMEVEIHGYTDSQGGARSNQRLSQRRADSVRAWLLRKGVVGSRVKAVGFGEDNPIADNRTAEGRSQNRRIEFVRTK